MIVEFGIFALKGLSLNRWGSAVVFVFALIGFELEIRQILGRVTL